MMTLYISGPMHGLPEHNHPAFQAAAKQLADAGYTAINPADNRPGMTRGQYMRLDYQHVIRADGIALLQGHHYSPGAASEIRAALDLDLPVATVEWWIELGRSISAAIHALRSYEHGNGTPDLAQDVADRLESIGHAMGKLRLFASEGGAQ